MSSKVQQLRIRMLYEQSFLSQVTGLANVAIVLYVTADLPDRKLTYAWAAAGVALFLLRVSAKIWFKKNYIQKDLPFNPRIWENLFCVSAALGGLHWAIPGVFLVDRDLVTYQTFIGFLLAGNTAGAAVAYSPSVRAVLSFMLPALIPYTVNLAFGGDAIHHGMAALTLLYMIMTSMLTLRVNRYVVKSIRLAFEKDDLVEALKTSQSKVMNSEKMAALGTMAGGIAHEINTPLASINLSMDVILDKAQNNALTPSYVERVAKEVNETVFRIAKIISALRSFSQENENQAYELIEVQKLIEDTLSLCQTRFKMQGMAIIAEPVPAGTKVLANPSQVSQMLMNLLTNASEAVKGRPSAWVKIEVETSGKYIEISVTDNGAGIPEANRDKIMQPFFTTKEVGKGTGLGLSMAHGIVEAHGGTLKLDTSSEWTRFVAAFPKPPALLTRKVS
jgi:signal transduction histidine kinase